MDNKIIKNYLYSTIVQIINIIIPFLTIPYISRVLIPEELGLYNYTLNVMTYFSIIAELGFQFYGQKVIVNSKSREEEEQNFLKILKMKVIFGCTILLIYLLVVIIGLNNKVVYLFQGIAILGVIIDITWYYAGKENFRKIAIRGVFLKLASFILLFIIVRGENALIKYVISIQIPNLVGNLLMYPGLGIKIRNIKLEVEDVKKTLLAAFALLIPSIMTSIYQIVDKAILGELSTMSQVGYYSQMLKLVGLFSAIVFSIGKVIFPRLVEYYHKGDNNNVKILMCEITSFVLHLGIPICIGMYCILDVFVPWFYGSQYLILIDYFPYALPLIIIISLNQIYSSQLLIAINEEKKLYCLIGVNIAVNVILDIIMIPYWDSIGALVASLIAEFIQFIGSVFVYKKIIGGAIFSKTNIIAIYAGVLMGIVLLLSKRFISLNSIIVTFILIILGMLVYFSVLIISRDSIIYKLIDLMKIKIGNKIN